MPYQVQSNYPGGASATSASGGGGNAYFDALLARENQALLAQQAQRGGTMTASARPAAGRGFGMNNAPVQDAGEKFRQDEDDAHRRAMQKQQLEAGAMKNQDMRAALLARSTPPPMKAATGFNMLGGPEGRDILQTNMLNAYQREAYLPKESGMVGSGTPTPTGSIASPNISAAMAGVQNTNVSEAVDRRAREERLERLWSQQQVKAQYGGR